MLAARFPPACPVAFDVGLNNGEDTLFLLRNGFCVLGVDANPQAITAARKLLSRCSGLVTFEKVSKPSRRNARCWARLDLAPFGPVWLPAHLLERNSRF